MAKNCKVSKWLANIVCKTWKVVKVKIEKNVEKECLTDLINRSATSDHMTLSYN